MSLYSGHNTTFADLIAAGISLRKYVDLLDQLIGPSIGQVKLTLDNTRPVLAETDGYIDLNKADKTYPNGFDGWVYANGAKIYKKQFPKAYEFFMNSSYPGKKAEGSTEYNYAVTIPNICKFIKINAHNSAVPIADYPAKYSIPNHVHNLGAIASDANKNKTITVKNAAWIWSTGVDTSTKGGKMPAINYGGVNIPVSPSAHNGKNNGFSHYVNWDVPVDINLNTEVSEFKSTTTLQQKVSVPLDGPSDGYYPIHVKIPALVFIGRKIYIN